MVVAALSLSAGCQVCEQVVSPWSRCVWSSGGSGGWEFSTECHQPAPHRTDPLRAPGAGSPSAGTAGPTQNFSSCTQRDDIIIIHPSIHPLSTTYPSSPRGSSFSSEPKSSLSLASEANSDWGIPRSSQAREEM